MIKKMMTVVVLTRDARGGERVWHSLQGDRTDWLVGEGGPSEPRGPNYIPAASVIFLTSIVL